MQFYTSRIEAMRINNLGIVSLTESLQIANTKNIQFIGSGGDHARISFTQGDGTTGDVWSHGFYQNSGFQASMDFLQQVKQQEMVILDLKLQQQKECVLQVLE